MKAEYNFLSGMDGECLVSLFFTYVAHLKYFGIKAVIFLYDLNCYLEEHEKKNHYKFDGRS